MKISRYKLSLLFHAFPAYSPSVFFSSMFVQPRWFSLPLLFKKNINIRLNKWKLLLLINIIICVTVPLIGIIFNRQFSLMDIAYMLSSIYTLTFITVTINNIGVFNRFISYFIIINFIYVIVQVLLFYVGLPELTMVHSNVPFQIGTHYEIPPGIILGFPRYTGLFVESSAFAFYLWLTFLYLMQQGVKSSNSIKYLVFIMIALSQSKFLLVLLPVFFVENLFSSWFPRIYKILTKPLIAFLITSLSLVIFISLIFTDLEIYYYLSKNIPAFDLRMSGIRYSIGALIELEPFGKGLLPSNIEVLDSTYELAGLDAFSIVIFGYGLYMGAAIITSILMFPILASIKYKFSFIAVLMLGFLSNGSLLIPPYMFAITYAVLAHYQIRSYKIHRNNSLFLPRAVVASSN